jgi:ribonuclease P protein component
VLVGPGPSLHGRLGITVSKRVGNAVTRNRIKRWVREFVRQQPADAWLPAGCDVVVIAKASAARVSEYRVIADDLAALGAKL